MENKKNYTQVSVGNWMLTFILLGIPIVNLVLIFVWAFSGTTPVSKRNFAIAALIMMLIGIVLAIVFWVFFAEFMSTFLPQGINPWKY